MIAELKHTILEGHRFAVRVIRTSEPLLSWGLAFGIATESIQPGEYVCNQSMLDALSVRRLDDASLPTVPNFLDHIASVELDERNFVPGVRAERVRNPGSFLGFRRQGNRGTGTRNFIVILGTSSRTASFARLLAERLGPLATGCESLDGIVAIAHTEGGGTVEPNNAMEVLKTLAGFMVHPNIAAVLAVDYGVEPIHNERLRQFMLANGYPLADVPHRFLSLHRGLSAGLSEGESIVRDWIAQSSTTKRTDEPLGDLRVALQCGGSDAFSGVSGNPLAGAMVHELIRHGGSGVLTETDEVVGAEAYILRNVRDLETARQFLKEIDDFKAYLAWHGVSSESNPSGGNKFRGLYNIALKSVGAVHKKDPRTTLDFVTHYADQLRLPGFYFMNGPGNDLEGIAGQVASGCNMILFVTGNGSVTNFPFVPTLKITTTTRRHNLLINEMDINAGRYLDGVPFESMASEAFATLVAAASGSKTKGERAGHSQVSIWRNWPQTDSHNLATLQAKPSPPGVPLRTAQSIGNDGANRLSSHRFFKPLHAYPTAGAIATERLGLVLPLSLCSSQVARLAADRLNESQVRQQHGISRFVALPHTEACGSSGESLFKLLHRSYQGYIMHPNIVAAFLLEHGCEKITNDAMRHDLERSSIDADRFGWASVQLDGGIAKALNKIEAWFSEKLSLTPTPTMVSSTIGELTMGILTASPVSASTARLLGLTACGVAQQGGSILIPASDPILANSRFLETAIGGVTPHATLAYGERIAVPGFHIVDSETEHWVENLTSLGACGAHVVTSIVSEHARQGHPMIPVVQIAEPSGESMLARDDIDLFLTGETQVDLDAIERKLIDVLRGDEMVRASAQGMVDFQFARGSLGVTS
ncbi:MAG: UxaA family hydrolase [Pirellula sp.]